MIAVPARSSGAGLQVSGSVLFAPSHENGREVSGPDRRFGSPTALGPKARKPGNWREVSAPVYWEGRNRWRQKVSEVGLQSGFSKPGGGVRLENIWKGRRREVLCVAAGQWVVMKTGCHTIKTLRLRGV